MLRVFLSKYKPGKGTFIHEFTEQAVVNPYVAFRCIVHLHTLWNPSNSQKQQAFSRLLTTLVFSALKAEALSLNYFHIVKEVSVTSSMKSSRSCWTMLCTLLHISQAVPTLCLAPTPETHTHKFHCLYALLDCKPSEGRNCICFASYSLAYTWRKHPINHWKNATRNGWIDRWMDGRVNK